MHTKIFQQPMLEQATKPVIVVCLLPVLCIKVLPWNCARMKTDFSEGDESLARRWWLQSRGGLVAGQARTMATSLAGLIRELVFFCPLQTNFGVAMALVALRSKVLVVLLVLSVASVGLLCQPSVRLLLQDEFERD